MTKTLVTHINPHLDDISAIWLFKKFHPEFRDARLEFVSASRDLAKMEETEDKIFIGTGGGKFDEHKGDLEDCATSLVWKDAKEKGLVPKDELELKAYEEFINWNLTVDLGRFPSTPFLEFTIPSFIRPRDNNPKFSEEAVKLGTEIFERLIPVLIRKQHSINDWENRVEFQTTFGKSFAVKSEAIDREFCKEKGGDLFLIFNTKDSSVQYFTPSFEIDLEPIYKKLKEADSDASWFLHQSHHIILCGAGSAPQFTKTKLSFEQLTDLIKSI